ncbi:hypothetical protein DFA_11450 [Cavenderia fasciculata]|uniref:Uncharacterized protein n=1 Tax=Cavenderia fasciculata TaxID=261658 RepID=F4QD08_CACFS|nr:uncharacterized protein DFA_11450 [Cavenderia fasciculata]EGG13689.1 hypothetical protein DFA_11450 [Cavenderia fasciculata]|eukprot:XP_004350393.1 hypothetical protein DFA_11450 [Cavenderia fasciculata]
MEEELKNLKEKYDQLSNEALFWKSKIEDLQEKLSHPDQAGNQSLERKREERKSRQFAETKAFNKAKEERKINEFTETNRINLEREDKTNKSNQENRKSDDEFKERELVCSRKKGSKWKNYITWAFLLISMVLSIIAIVFKNSCPEATINYNYNITGPYFSNSYFISDNSTEYIRLPPTSIYLQSLCKLSFTNNISFTECY